MTGLISKEQRGEKRPSSASLKLLSIVDKMLLLNELFVFGDEYYRFRLIKC
jgi:hypothetical protein